MNHLQRRVLTRAATTLVAVFAVVLPALPVAAAASAPAGLCTGQLSCHKVASVDFTGDGRPDQVATLTGLSKLVGVRFRTAGASQAKIEYLKAGRWKGLVYLGAAQIDEEPGLDLVIGKVRSGHVQQYYVLAWRFDLLVPIQPGTHQYGQGWGVARSRAVYMGITRSIVGGTVQIVQRVARRTPAGHYTGSTAVWQWDPATGGFAQLSKQPTSYPSRAAAARIGGWHLPGVHRSA
jgi:hypothetical protein